MSYIGVTYHPASHVVPTRALGLGRGGNGRVRKGQCTAAWDAQDRPTGGHALRVATPKLMCWTEGMQRMERCRQGKGNAKKGIGKGKARAMK